MRYLAACLVCAVPYIATAAPEVVGVRHFTDYEQEVAGTGVKFSMVAVRGGTFRLGSPMTEPGRRDNEGPRHKVRVQPFWMGKCEVTWDEYHAYMRETKFDLVRDPEVPGKSARQRKADAVTKPTASYIDETYGFGTEGYPAFNMSHHAAMKYCEWLSAKTGRTYRLPTEAEWEYACRAGGESAYPFGDKADDLGDYAWYAGNSGTADRPRGQTHPVGTKKANAFGLHDMLGNVAEWCLDRYDPDFYDALPWDSVPVGPVNRPGPYRYPHTARGGWFRSQAADCRSAARVPSNKVWNSADPQEPQSVWWLVPGRFVGFRVVRPVDEYPALVGLKSLVTPESE